MNLVEAEAVEIGITGGSRPARSNPVNMPHAASRSLVPVVIDGSGSKLKRTATFANVTIIYDLFIHVTFFFF